MQTGRQRRGKPHQDLGRLQRERDRVSFATHKIGIAGGGLTEEDTSSGRQILRCNSTLDCDHGNLESHAPAGAGNDLITNPFASRGVDIKKVQETSTDGSDGRSTDQKRLVVSSGRHNTTAGDGGDGDSDDERQVPNPARGRAGVVNRLEVDGDVVDGDEKGAGEDEGESTHDGDSSVLDDVR